jgi:hypothetical protein
MSVIIKLLSKFDDSGLRKAKAGFSGLGKALGAVGIGFGLKAITDTLINAAKAAAADAKSTKLLNIQLERNAGATAESLKENDKFIESLSLQTGIMDDDLRPAMARFGNITGNVKDAQKLLKITLDAAAGSGRSQEKISKAVGQAYGGNTKALQRMFPELRKSKDVLGDFAKTYKGLAVANADPFMKFNNSMDILKEKLGVIVLPSLLDFIETISKPGGAIETVGKFFEEISNPKTEVGSSFVALKETIGGVGKNIAALFALMDPSGKNNPMSGFAKTLQTISDIIGGISDGLTVIGGSISKLMSGDIQGFLDLMNAEVTLGAASIRRNLSVQKTIEAINAETLQTGKGSLYTGDGYENNNVIIGSPAAKKPKFPMVFKQGMTPQNQVYNITINNTSADPKTVTDALGKYVKANGSLPFNLATAGKKP